MDGVNPENPGYDNLQPARRFEADLHYAASFFDLYNAFTTYLKNQFSIHEEAAMRLYTEVSGALPSAELFDDDVDMAHEQIRLGLMRIALPLAEDLIGPKEKFINWVVVNATVAMDTVNGSHKLEECVEPFRGPAEFSCAIGPNCPVKVTKTILMTEIMRPDFGSLNYQGPWADKKIERTLAKLDAALRLGLVLGQEAETWRKNYLYRCQAHDMPVPETGDI